VAFTSSTGHTRSALAEINVTPLVDVVLVLLIIFMITAPVLQSGIEVAVPKTRTVKEITEQRLVLTIDKSQNVYLGDKQISIHDIGQRLHQQNPARSSTSAPTRPSPLASLPNSWMRSNKPESPMSPSSPSRWKREPPRRRETRDSV
jgi:biopolymer transport protein ExbD